MTNTASKKKPVAKAKAKNDTTAVSSSLRAVSAKQKTDKSVEAKTEMSTDVFSKEMLTEFRKRSKAIKDSIGKIDDNFEKIAFNLHWINRKQAFKSDGFSSIVEYAQNTFGYQKTTCYSLISVVDRFAKRDDKGIMLESFDDRVKGFSTSKLSLMVNLTDAEIDSLHLNPGMSVRDIKALVKSLDELPEDSPEPDDSSADDADGDKSVIDVESKDVTRQVLISCKGRNDYDAKIDKIDDFVTRVFSKHPDALIEVSYTLPDAAGKKG